MTKNEPESGGIKIISENRKARFNYHILENFEAGLVLSGAEIKSIRAGGISLQESYVRPSNGELLLLGAHIMPYEHSTNSEYDPVRPRKLLMHKVEILKLQVKVEQKGLTIVALKVYLKAGRAKIEIGLAKGKAAPDKREGVKDREAQRDIARVLKENR